MKAILKASAFINLGWEKMAARENLPNYNEKARFLGVFLGRC